MQLSLTASLLKLCGYWVKVYIFVRLLHLELLMCVRWHCTDQHKSKGHQPSLLFLSSTTGCLNYKKYLIPPTPKNYFSVPESCLISYTRKLHVTTIISLQQPITSIYFITRQENIPMCSIILYLSDDYYGDCEC